MPTINYTESLTTCTCWCGIHLAVPDNLYEHAHQDGDQAIYCPLGHRFYYKKNTYKQRLADTEVRLSREQQRLQATRDLLHAEERSHAATRGVVTRQKKKLTRVTNGVCPCCNRTFQNLMRHMDTKHPDYATTVDTAA